MPKNITPGLQEPAQVKCFINNLERIQWMVFDDQQLELPLMSVMSLGAWPLGRVMTVEHPDGKLVQKLVHATLQEGGSPMVEHPRIYV